MIDVHRLHEDIAALLTCAPTHCAKEDACLRVAKALRALLPERVGDDPDDDVVQDYAPDWSGA